jgi:ABC-type lipoprotein release transport system permease subunit
VLRTLAWHWRVHLAVALGAAVACAVLAGALLVGDSVRGSLRALTLDRLGEVDYALASRRFFRESLAADLAHAPGFAAAFAEPVPAIVLRGSATRAESGARAARIGIHGIDARFAALFDVTLDLARAPGQLFPPVVINHSLARELQASPGDEVLLTFGRSSAVPRETLMGEKDTEDVLGSLRLAVAAVIPDRGLGRFGLAPRQTSAPSAFVDRTVLQRALAERARVNAILLAARPGATLDPQQALGQAVRLEDYGLAIRARDDQWIVDSREFVLRPEIETAVADAARALAAPLVRVQTYLAIKMQGSDPAAGSDPVRFLADPVPYSTVAAIDAPPDAPDWARLPLSDGGWAGPLAEDGILLNTWAADALDARPGDTIELTYHVVGPREELAEATAAFRVEGVVALEGLAADRTLTPDYPGIQDAEDMANWDPPFPVDLESIRTEDELYWDEHGATPKAFVAPATARRLWSTRFGAATALRIGLPPGHDPAAFEARLAQGILSRLSPDAFDLTFRPVKAEGLRAASGSTDFATLFLSFSVFLIVSAALLVGLLFRLGVERRASEIGLLLAVGYAVARVRARLLAEGLALAAVGAAAGLAGAAAFAGAMMLGLRTIWRPAVGSSELYLHVTLPSLAIGWASTIAVVTLSVLLAVRKLVRVAPPRLLAGALAVHGRRGGWPSRVVAWGGLAGAPLLALLAALGGAGASPGLAFGSGSLLLAGALAAFTRWCRNPRRRRRIGSLAGMAARNSAWNPGRSVLSVALVGCACFMVVVVEAFRVEPGADLDRRDSGAGGFRLVAESNVPLHQDLERPAGRFELGFTDEEAATLDGARIFPARVLPGDDASCNNLYRPARPTLVGLPPDLIRRGGFRFASALDAATGDEPWSALLGALEPDVIPAIADQSSAQWILHLGLGDELTIEDEAGRPLRLRLVALLDRSLFRSEILVAESHLLRHFPSLTGDAYFLIETPPDRAAEVARVLESRLGRFGLDVTATADRLAGYEAVQNTYLSTFQVLGGLGLLLGTLGLGIVLVRNVLERRGELGALRAFGYPRARLGFLVLAENAFLLSTGVAAGTIAALAAVAPGLAGRGWPWPALAATLALVLSVGMLASLAAVAGALRVPLLPVLKAER